MFVMASLIARSASGPIRIRDLSSIEALAEDLAGDDVVFQRHLSKLQTLDTTTQVLRKLAGARIRPSADSD